MVGARGTSVVWPLGWSTHVVLVFSRSVWGKTAHSGAHRPSKATPGAL